MIRRGRSEGDPPVKYKIRRACQTYVRRAAFAAVEAYLEFSAALHTNADGRLKMMQFGGDESRGGHTGAAGEGFALDSALVGADADGIRAEELGEIDVGPARGEMGMVSDFGANGANHGFVGVVGEEDGVRDAGIDGMNGCLAGLQGHELVEAEVAWRRQVDGDVLAMEGSGNNPSLGLKGNAE